MPAEKKKPRRTAERILEVTLEMFNRFGEPNVSTTAISSELNISPGNLYYHFRNKDEIIGELAAAFDASVTPLFAVPRTRAADVEDLWLLLHLLFERMGDYRFLLRDVDELTSRNRKLASRFADLVRRASAAVRAMFDGMVAAGTMRASPHEVATLAHNVVLVSTYWMSFQRLSHGPLVHGDPLDAGRAAYQVMALIAPYLQGDARALLDMLGADYL
jgi:AcrR family transcriptional regulator